MERLPKAQNIRYWLWKDSPDQENWESTLAQWLRSDYRRAKAILDGAFLESREVQYIAQALDITEEAVQYASPESYGVDVLHENLKYLIEMLEYGEKTKFANHLGVDPDTVSKWGSGRQNPPAERQKAICEYFCLPPDTDLKTDALFLNTEPISHAHRRAWVIYQLNAMSADTLRALFPALKRLFKDP